MLAIDGMLKFATAFLTYVRSDRDGESPQALSYVGALLPRLGRLSALSQRTATRSSRYRWRIVRSEKSG